MLSRDLRTCLLLGAACVALSCARRQPGGDEADALRLVTPEGHTAPTYAAGFSPDGRLVLTGSDDGTARIWETATGREVRRLSGDSVGRDTAWVRGASFSPDGRHVLTASRDGKARLWEAATGRLIDSLAAHSGPLTSAAFSPDGRLAVTTSLDGSAIVWNAVSRARVGRVAHGARVNSAAFSADGRYLVTAAHDSTAIIWNSTSGASVCVLRHPGFWVASAAISPSAEVVVTASEETVRLWSVQAGGACSVRGTLAHARVMSVGFSSDGRRLVTAGEDGFARVWDAATLRPLVRMESRTPSGLPASLRAASFSPDGRFVVTAGGDTAVRVWDAASGREFVRLTRRAHAPAGVAFSPDGRLVATASTDSVARVWELATGQELSLAGSHARAVRAVSFSPDGRMLATASYDGRAQLWNAATGAVAGPIVSHQDWILSAAFSADGRSLVTASSDSTARVWEVASGRSLAVIDGHSHWVTAAAFSPASPRVATASYDSTVRISDAATGAEVRRLGGHRDLVWDVAYSPDGARIVTASDDGTAIVWDTLGREVRRLRGHTGFVRSASFSSDGRLVVSASHDRTARIWDAATGRMVKRLEGHTGWVTSAAFSPDGRFVATASTDGTTRVWKSDTGTELFRRFALDSADWVVVAPDGRFDGSEGGMRRLHYARGLATIALESFFDRFYTPGLAGLLLAGAPYDGPDIRRGYKAPPVVRIASPLSGESKDVRTTVTIEVRDEGGGVEDLRLYHNNAVVARDKALRRGTGYCPERTTCFQADVELLAGMNTLEASAFSTDRTESERDRVTLAVDADSATATLHIVAVGINTYTNPRYNLSYGRDDALAFANEIREGARGVLSTGVFDTLFDANATRANIASAFARVAAVARPQDVFVFFYAGHGTTERVAGTTTFFLVPANVENATEPAELARKGISGEQLRQMLESVPALKKIMIVDACQSGAAVAGFARRGAAEERAIAQLARSSGVFVMSSTDSEQFAREVNVLGHGILTYALLSALDAPAADTTGVRLVRQVLSDAERVTRELSVQLRDEPQYPMVHSAGMDFPIGLARPRATSQQPRRPDAPRALPSSGRDRTVDADGGDYCIALPSRRTAQR